MPRPLTLLHTSDCHLGSSTEAREEKAFARMMDLATTDAVDAVLIAGDLFDHARVTDDVLEFAAAQLDRAGCPVVLLPGNHDLYHDVSVYRRLDFAARCRQVQVITDPDGQLVHVDELDLTVWGRAMFDHSPDFRPMVGVPERLTDRWCVVAGHGLVTDSDRPSDRGSPIYPRDLDAIDWDYVALGHAGCFRLVREGPVPVVYPGPDHGQPRRQGATLVHLVPGLGAKPEFVFLN